MKPAFTFPKVILAPLSGISCLAFRTISRGGGCKFAFIEMISARSLSYESPRTLRMLRTSSTDRPLGVQFLTDREDDLARALDVLKDFPCDVLDLNAACPEKKVTSGGKGAALLKEPKKLQELLSFLVKRARVPVTAKIRVGWDNDESCVDIARRVRDSGVAALTVHARTRNQGYRSPVRYDAVRRIKKAVDIPVVASGDILSGSLAKKMFDETGCDSVAVARGALGNPWIFSEIEAFLEHGSCGARPEADEVSRVMKSHLRLLIDIFTERTAIINFRKFFIWYSRGFHNAKQMRMKVPFIHTRSEMEALIDELTASERV